MGLGDITGVFSRYFVVGFFLPAYVWLIVLWKAASSAFIPNVLEHYKEPTQLLILGAVALVAGLALSGCNYLITRAFEGYPLLRFRRWPVVKLIPRTAIAAQRFRFDRLSRVRDGQTSLPADRAEAAWILDRFYPGDANDLLPTRLGNAIRAFERYSNVRWGLDGVTIWPRIDALLGEDERGIHVDAKIDLYVFLNGALGGFVVGVCLVVDKSVNVPQPALHWPLYVLPFAVGYVLYRAALPPAANWGDAVRASIDVHRLELYEKLGVRAPLSFSDEKKMAVRVNQALLYGQPPLSNDLWRKAEDAPQHQRPADRSELLSWIEKLLKGGEPG
jgi:hypothetical protein